MTDVTTSDPDEAVPAAVPSAAVERLLARLSHMADPKNDFADGDASGQVTPLGGSIFGAMAPQIVANGWSIFPQMAIGERRMPGRVDGQTIRWREEHHLEETLPRADVLGRWASQCRGHNIALVCGRASGDVFAVDIDILDPAWNGKILRLALDILGHTPFRRVGKAPKIVLLYRWHEFAGDEDAPGSRAFRFADGDGQSSDGIEILSRGKPVTIFGMHHTTGRDFRWSGPTPFDSKSEDVPRVTPEQMTRFIEAVGVARPFYKGSSFTEGGAEVVWEIDPDTDIVVPRMRLGKSKQVEWVEGRDGKVVDGREAYLHKMIFMMVTNNPGAVGSKGKPNVKGVNSLKKKVLDQFRATAELSGRWLGSKLEFEVSSRIDGLVRKVHDGVVDMSRAPPKRARDGGLLMRDIRVADRPPLGGVDSLSFLPSTEWTEAGAVTYTNRLPLRSLSATNESMEADQIARRRGARAIVTDRSHESSRTSTTIDAAVGAFLDDVYAPLEERRNVVHLLKTPTGSGKTSRTFRTIAFDERTKEQYQIEGKDGPETGRFPFLVLMPTYANIDELKSRSDILNLDPDLDDDQFREAAEELGLLSEEAVGARIAELRKEARAAGLRTMVYRGKVAAGCRMAEKLSMAMKAGISTSGFCRSETRSPDAEPGAKAVPEYCVYHPDINNVEPCPAILQRLEVQKSHVVFLPHAFMALTLPEELKKVRAVIADERIHNLFLHMARFPMSTFLKARSPPRLTKKERAAGVVPEELVQDRDHLAKWAMAALRSRLDPAREIMEQCMVLARADKSKMPEADAAARAKSMLAHAKRCCAGSWDIGRMITPLLEIEDLRIICETPTGINIREEFRFWSLVLEDVEKDSESAVMASLREAGAAPPPAPRPDDRRIQLLTLVEEDQAAGGAAKPGEERELVRISWRTEPNWPDRPLLLLDASAAPEIVCKVLKRGIGDVKLTPLETSMNIQTVALIDRTYATTAITPFADDGERRFNAAVLIDKLRRFLSLLSPAYGWSRVIAGTTMSARRVLNTGWRCPENIDWVHFGALRGLDFAKHHEAAVSIGRLEPPLWAVDGMVAALTYDDEEPEDAFDAYGTGYDAEQKRIVMSKISTTIRMRSGHDYELDVPGFPRSTPEREKRLGRDTWHRIVHRQFREEEQSQFLGRLRPVYREGNTPVWFCVAQIIPEGVICDDLLTLDDLVSSSLAAKEYPPALFEAVRRAGGVLHPAVAACRGRFGRSVPDLYASPEDVRKDMARIGLSDETGAHEDQRFAWGFNVVRLGLAGGGDTFVYVRMDVRDPGAAAADALEASGVPVASVIAVVHPRQRSANVVARGPDKVDHEPGLRAEDRAVVEAELVDMASLKAWKSLRPVRSGEEGAGWFKGLRHPGEDGRLPLPLAPRLSGERVPGRNWEIGMQEKTATLAQRCAYEALERFRAGTAAAPEPDPKTPAKIG